MNSCLAEFANNAPPVPDWFEATGPLPAKPPSVTAKFGEERAYTFFHMRAQRKPIPDDLAEVEDYFNQIQADQLIYEAAVREIRFFQWRAYYARRMVEVLGEVPHG